MAKRFRSTFALLPLLIAMSGAALAQQDSQPATPGRTFDPAPPVFPSRPPPAAMPAPAVPEARGGGHAPEDTGNAPATGGCKYYQRKLELIV